MMVFKNLMKKMRRSTFDFEVVDGRSIGQIVLEPLIRNSAELLTIDIGARNGMQLLPSTYCANSSFIGFEPNPEEYQKLITKNTDAHKIGAHIPAFLNQKYYPYAVWDINGNHDFYITVGPGASTLMGKTQENVTRKMFLDYPDERRFKSFEELHSTVKNTVSVPCCKLDDLLKGNQICDFMKLDVEGAEMRCLKGAQDMFKKRRVLFVYTEFVAFPYYQEHCILGDQHSFLNNHGFRLMDIDMGHSSYRRSPRELPISADRRLLHAGDAFFCLDPDRNILNAEEKQRISALCFIFGFNSMALDLLREAELTPISDIRLIHNSIVDTYTIKRLKNLWSNFPRQIAQKIRGY
jgi:FkbM family methyltransferase